MSLRTLLLFFMFCFTIMATVYSRFINSQGVNWTLISNFKYQCGLDRCGLLTQFCVRDGIPHCEYCTEDVCNSDPQDYPGCEIACDIIARKKVSVSSSSKTYSPSIGTSTISTGYASEETTTPSTKLRAVECELVKTGLITVSVFLFLLFLLNGILVFVFYICRLRRKAALVESKVQKDQKNLQFLQRQLEGGNVSIGAATTNVSEIIPDIPSHVQNSNCYPESGYNTPNGTPDQQRKDITNQDNRSETTSLKQEIESNEQTRKNYVSIPQGACYEKADDYQMLPSGTNSVLNLSKKPE